MLNYINLQNFRAYKNQQFDFSKINIFMGPNNSGKSSAISAINLLAQTIKNQSSVLLLNGQHEELGTYIDAVHGKNSQTSMGFDFGINNADISLRYKYRPRRREISLNKFSLSMFDKNIYSYTARRDAYEIRYGQEKYEDAFPGTKKTQPDFYGLWPSDSSFYRKRVDLDRTSEAFKSYRKLKITESQVHRQFNFFDSISPFRQQPNRTYLYSGEAPEYVGRNGENGVSLLVGDSSRRGSARLGILDWVNDFFKESGIAKGLVVENLTSRHFELCIVDHSGKKHNICDSGFGCSQVLPVLISGLNLYLKKTPDHINKTFIVQEPEIHLHPDAQAALGTFFAKLSNLSNGQMFIETHSDHLVLRLARHVITGELKPEDIMIYYVQDIEGEKKVTKMQFDENGVFSPEWPGGFLPQRKEESLQLAKARMDKRKSS